MNQSDDRLPGGNMNAPILRNHVVYKNLTPASPNIHKLLGFVREKGITWVPQTLGIMGDKHAFSFIPGNVIHTMPFWIWDESILIESARKLRQWHDATISFQAVDQNWVLQTNEEPDVICHNDFAPYNWVFDDQRQLIGLIDFDTCAPGTRIWDIAYTAYRIVPLLPDEKAGIGPEVSPFQEDKIFARLTTFLHAYASGDNEYLYQAGEVIGKLQKRLRYLAEWSEKEGSRTGNSELIQHAKMYACHCQWVSIFEAETIKILQSCTLGI